MIDPVIFFTSMSLAKFGSCFSYSVHVGGPKNIGEAGANPLGMGCG